jgi:hypothetical protein
MWLNVGQKVTGAYMGSVRFNGTIKESRFVTVRNDTIGYVVDLSEPIEVYGTKRESLMVHVGFDGRGTTYVDPTEYIEAI